MPAPNLLIVGCQKGGTSWTHASLQKSRHVFASEVKELGFFLEPQADRSWDRYLANFPEKPGATWYMESTPHYFQLPFEGHDVAADIARTLPGVRPVIILRNPVDRYESAVTHHMDKNRIPYTPVITEMSDAQQLLALGRFGSILAHWKAIFPDIGVFFYDDLKADRMKFLDGLMSFLGLQNDLTEGMLDYRRNEKRHKARYNHPEWRVMPRLSADLKEDLRQFYFDEICWLEELSGRDLSAWRAPRRDGSVLTTLGPSVTRYMRRALRGRWV